jgi:type II secretory pathway component PulF
MFSDLLKEKIFFTQNLYLMTKGGLSISESLETLKEETRSKAFKKTLEDILKRTLEGEALHQSMARHPKIFNQFFQSIIRIGEESGTLEENLKYLSSQLKSEYEIKKKVQGALVYPIIVVLLALVIAFFTSLFILPRVTNLFMALRIQLPLATRILIGSTAFFRHNWPWIIVGIVLIIILFRFLKKLKLFKYYLERITLSLPFFGRISKNFSLASFAQNSYTLLKSGIPILESLEICINNAPNEVFKNNLSLVKLEVEKGGTISLGLKNYPKTFPPIFSQMILIGEKSGSLEDSFLYLSSFYQEEVDSILNNLSVILEPVLLILVGIFVGFIALAIITPLYKFTGSIRFK